MMKLTIMTMHRRIKGITLSARVNQLLRTYWLKQQPPLSLKTQSVVARL